MINTKIEGLNVLLTLINSEFVFMDDEIFGRLDNDLSFLRDTSVITNAFYFIVEESRRIKPFLKKLGFEPLPSNANKETRANRSVKFFTAANYQIYVTVVKSFEMESKFVSLTNERSNIVNRLTTKNVLEAMSKINN